MPAPAQPKQVDPQRTPSRSLAKRAKRTGREALLARVELADVVARVLETKHGLDGNEARRLAYGALLGVKLFRKGRTPANVDLYIAVERIREANGGRIPDGRSWDRQLRAWFESLTPAQQRTERQQCPWLFDVKGQLKPRGGFWDALARQHNAGEVWDDSKQRQRPKQERRLLNSPKSAERAYATAKRLIEGTAAKLATDS